MLTKQHFEAIAKIIKLSDADLDKMHPFYGKVSDKDLLMQHLEDYFLSQNKSFDWMRFEKACKG